MANQSKSAKKAIAFLIDIPLYPFRIYVAQSDDKESCLSEFENVTSIDMSSNEDNLNLIFNTESTPAMTFTYNDIGYYILVCRDNISLSDLSHEAFHLTSGAMRFIGCDLNEGSEEAYAYLHGFVFGEIAKKLNYKK